MHCRMCDTYIQDTRYSYRIRVLEKAPASAAADGRETEECSFVLCFECKKALEAHALKRRFESECAKGATYSDVRKENG